MVKDIDIDAPISRTQATVNRPVKRPSARLHWVSTSAQDSHSHSSDDRAPSSTASNDRDLDLDDSFASDSTATHAHPQWTNPPPRPSSYPTLVSAPPTSNANVNANANGYDDFRDSLYNSSTSSAGSQHGPGYTHARNSHIPMLQRPSDYGSDVMLDDDGYRSTAIVHKRAQVMQNVHGLTPLLQAARDGDVVLLNTLIVQPGTDILRRDPVYGQTALHFAIRGGHLAIVQALLMPELAGSIINIPDSRRNTALHLAAAKSRRMTKLLLDVGADVNFLNMRNQTPLGVHILTAMHDDPSMTEILLQGRANPNSPVDTSTLLHVALDKKLFLIAQRLVRHGARLDLKDHAGRMVFDKVDARTLKQLLSKATVAPHWVPDSDRLTCMNCDKAFGSLGTRRHHCRYCGRVLCAKCTTHSVRYTELPFSTKSLREQKPNKSKSSGNKKQRVCATCYEIFMKGDVDSPTTASMSNPNVMGKAMTMPSSV